MVICFTNGTISEGFLTIGVYVYIGHVWRQDSCHTNVRFLSVCTCSTELVLEALVMMNLNHNRPFHSWP